ncbi:MAG: hypothetical protein RL754_1076 [Bacteroidota bacterium]|jgi:hypothetical protein
MIKKEATWPLLVSTKLQKLQLQRNAGTQSMDTSEGT